MGLPDTSNVEDKDFEVLPPGTYNVVLHHTEEQTSKSGKDFLNVQLRTDSNKVIFDKCFYQDNCLWKLKSLKKAIGMPDTETRIEPYWGTRLVVKVSVRNYEGEDQNEVKQYKAIAGNAQPKSEPEKKPAPSDDKMPWDD